METQKMKLKIHLSSFNPSIYKFQKIPVLLYHYDGVRAEASKQGDFKREEAGFTDQPFGMAKGEDQNDAKQVVDRFLSGHYIIENIDYYIDDPEQGLRQVVTLMRREWPTRIKNLE